MIHLLYEIPDIVRFNSQIKINIGAQQERSELFPEGYIKATDNDILGESAITKPSSTEVNKQYVQPNCNSPIVANGCNPQLLCGEDLHLLGRFSGGALWIWGKQFPSHKH